MNSVLELNQILTMSTPELSLYIQHIQSESVSRLVEPFNVQLKRCYKNIQVIGWKERKQLSYNSLADLIGKSKNQINNIMAGKSCSKTTLIILCLAIGIQPIDSISILSSAGYGFNVHEIKDAVLQHALFTYYSAPYELIWKLLSKASVIDRNQYAPATQVID